MGEWGGYLCSHEESKVLLGLWCERNKAVFLRLPKEMNEMGYERTYRVAAVSSKSEEHNFKLHKDNGK